MMMLRAKFEEKRRKQEKMHEETMMFGFMQQMLHFSQPGYRNPASFPPMFSSPPFRDDYDNFRTITIIIPHI